MLLLDDCSTDDSIQIAKEYAQKDPRIKLLQNSSNIGVAETRNQGISLANGKWISFLDSDDLWEPEKLNLQLNLAKAMNGKFIFGEYFQINEQGKFLKHIHCPPSIDYEGMLMGSEVGCLTAMIDSEILKKHKFKDTFHEDYLLWLEILKNDCKLAYAVQNTIACYRIRTNSRSANKIACAKAQWNIYRKHENLKFHQSIFYFLIYTRKGLSKHWHYWKFNA